ncbi:MAG: leucine-rich repeat domain-containing protein [Promethearchaeota archaeon]
MINKIKVRNELVWKSQAELLNKLGKKADIIFQCEDSHVTEISIWDNPDLQSIKDEIIAFPKLESIAFKNKDMDTIPHWLSQCMSLRTLYFANKTPRDYTALQHLPQLETLFLSESHLTDLPMICESLSNLKMLGLSFNALEQVPEVILNFTKLEHLFLGCNNLTSIPDWFSEALPNLQSLDLNDNYLQPVPRQIFQLHNLTYLELNANNLKEIPPEIVQLENLEILSLIGNEITMLPEELLQLKNLKTVYLENNPIKEDEIEHITAPLRERGCHFYFW